jgi:hypothetical protein
MDSLMGNVMGGVMVSLSVKDIPEQYAILKVLNFEM